MRRLALVSALFDLARREPEAGRRTAAEYLDGAGFLFGLDLDLVVFADPDLVDEIAARRAAASLAARTWVIPIALEQTTAAARLPAIEAARRGHPLLNGNPAIDTPLYTVVGWAKFELVRRAIEGERFDATHWAWIDLNLSARPDPADAVFANPRDRVTLLQMRGFRAEELDDRAAYLSYLRGHLAAGYIPAERRNWLRLAASFEAAASAALDAGFAPSGEQLLPELYRREPDLFELRLGDYDAMLANHLVLRTSAANLVLQMRIARLDGHSAHARAVCAAVLEGVHSGSLDASGAPLAELLDECFLAQWCGGAVDRDQAAEIARLYLDLTESDPDFREAFLRHEIRVRENFALVVP
jgi:hypothetical protein